MAPRIVDVRLVYDGWAKISIATAEMENGRRFERLMEDHGSGICVLPYDPTRKVATLVRQFRAPVCAKAERTDLLEAPAGLTDGEEPETAALRELFEETGLRVPVVDLVATLWTMPGISTERMDLFLARYSESDRVGSGGGHASEFEDITVVEIPLPQLAAMAEGGMIEDLKTFGLVQTLRLRQPTLF